MSFKQRVYADVVRMTHKRHKKSLMEMAASEYLSCGTFRNVFATELNPSIVLKMSKEDIGPASNLMEYTIWHEFMVMAVGKKWLAPCYEVYDDGKILTQKRLEIFTSKNDKRLPKKIPKWMVDTKVSNWGIDPDDGKPKCCDYGNLHLLKDDPWKLVDAEWWELEDD